MVSHRGAYSTQGCGTRRAAPQYQSCQSLYVPEAELFAQAYALTLSYAFLQPCTAYTTLVCMHWHVTICFNITSPVPSSFHCPSINAPCMICNMRFIVYRGNLRGAAETLQGGLSKGYSGMHSLRFGHARTLCLRILSWHIWASIPLLVVGVRAGWPDGHGWRAGWSPGYPCCLAVTLPPLQLLSGCLTAWSWVGLLRRNTTRTLHLMETFEHMTKQISEPTWSWSRLFFLLRGT